MVELWDGLGWYQPISNCEFEVTGFAPNSVSLWAGNYANGGGHDVVVDWIQDSFDPIDPEDGPLAGGVGRTLSVTVVDTTGQPITGGEVVADPDQTEFWCSEDVQLTAIAQPGWLFDRWEGDLSDPGDALSEQITVSMGVDRVLTAVFAEDTSPPIVVAGTVQIAAGQESAVVTWSSNQPTEAWLEFGTVGTPLVNRVDSVSPGAPPQVHHSVVLSGLTPDEAYDFQITVANLNGVGLATGVLETETPLRDDFNTCDPADVLATWSLIDPVGDAVFRVEGGGTADAFAVLEVPPGVSHPANATNLPPRIERAIGRSLFEHEVFMASVPTQQTQLQGVLYRESASDRWLGVFYQYVNGLVRYLVAFVGPDEPGGPATLKAIKSGPVNGSISSLGFRVERPRPVAHAAEPERWGGLAEHVPGIRAREDPQ